MDDIKADDKADKPKVDSVKTETPNVTELPKDITEDERRDYERTGTLELYTLRRDAEKAAREKARLRAEAAEAAEAEAQKKALRDQLKDASPGTTLVCPSDANDMERRDFERTGSLELYELNRQADKIQRERIRLRQEAAEIAQAEEHKRALRHQAEFDRYALEAERKKLALPPTKSVWDDAKPIPGSENLPEVVKEALRRLFYQGNMAGDWSEASQFALVKVLLAMSPAKSMAWAAGMRDAIAADAYDVSDLTPMALVRGSTGLKQLAGPAMSELKALTGGGGRPEPKALSHGKKRDKKKGRRDVIEVEAERIQESEGSEGDSDEDTIDDSPNQEAENTSNPWGEFD